MFPWTVQDPLEIDLDRQVLVGVENIDFRQAGMKRQVLIEDVQWMVLFHTEVDLEDQVLVGVQKIEAKWQPKGLKEGDSEGLVLVEVESIEVVLEDEVLGEEWGMKREPLMYKSRWTIQDPTEVVLVHLLLAEVEDIEVALYKVYMKVQVYMKESLENQNLVKVRKTGVIFQMINRLEDLVQISIEVTVILTQGPIEVVSGEDIQAEEVNIEVGQSIDQGLVEEVEWEETLKEDGNMVMALCRDEDLTVVYLGGQILVEGKNMEVLLWMAQDSREEDLEGEVGLWLVQVQIDGVMKGLLLIKMVKAGMAHWISLYKTGVGLKHKTLVEVVKEGVAPWSVLNQLRDNMKDHILMMKRTVGE